MADDMAGAVGRIARRLRGSNAALTAAMRDAASLLVQAERGHTPLQAEAAELGLVGRSSD